MSIKCLFGHTWNGYECEKCGATRKPKLILSGTETVGEYTYEDYAASSAEEAKLFLSFCKVVKPFYYIVVKTPEGIWGLDKHGLYLEKLLPFQKEVLLEQCKGYCKSFPYTITMVKAIGLSGIFVCDIVCGICGHTWKDGIELCSIRKTIVKCPKCKNYNGVDTSDIYKEVVKKGNF